MIADSDPRGSLLVAISEEKIVGFCSVGPSRDVDMPDFGELSAIYVSPSFQGHGAGLTLMNTGLDFLRRTSYAKAMLWVLGTNTTAINLYAKYGWKADDAEKKDIRDGYTLQEFRYRKEF
jgi:ribosomal protein S18 acetylase RimI-like enzyme